MCEFRLSDHKPETDHSSFINFFSVVYPKLYERIANLSKIFAQFTINRWLIIVKKAYLAMHWNPCLNGFYNLFGIFHLFRLLCSLIQCYFWCLCIYNRTQVMWFLTTFTYNCCCCCCCVDLSRSLAPCVVSILYMNDCILCIRDSELLICKSVLLLRRIHRNQVVKKKYLNKCGYFVAKLQTIVYFIYNLFCKNSIEIM